MKKIFIYFLPVILFSAMVCQVQAQSGLLRYAQRKAAESNYFEAANGYAKAYSKKATYTAAKGAAESFTFLRDYQKSHDWWEKAVKFPDATNNDWLAYIEAANQADQREAVFIALDSMNGSALALNLDSLKSWYGSKPNSAVVGVDGLNTNSAEFGFTKDSNGTVYFSSDRGGELDRNKKGLRIDKSYKYYNKKSDWTGRDFLSIYKMDDSGEMEKLSIPVPDVFHSTEPYVLQESPVLFYTVSREIRKSGSYEVHSEIYYSSINEEGQLSDFKGLSINAPLEYSLKTPFVDEEEKRLYFSSDMPGGFGGFDLYYMDYSDDFVFEAPVNLGSEINTAGNESNPYLKEEKLFFASDGHVGLGGLDLFEAKVLDKGFSGVKNLGLPYNSPQDDFGFFITSDNKTILSSDRPESKGWDDIFELETRYKDFQALILGCDGEQLTGDLEVSLMEGTDRINVEVKQDGRGKLEASIAPEEDFEMVIKKDGYFSIHDKSLSTKGLKEASLEKTYQMVRVPYNTTAYVDLVFYNLDESIIRDDAKPSLDKVAELLKSYSFLNIAVRSHTDARASEAYNEALSERRADAVRDYLGQFGIARSRIEAEWFGEKEPANDCGDGVPCPEDQHQINRRTELLLLAFPEEGKAYQLPPEMQDLDLCDVSNIQLPADLPTIYFGFDQASLSVNDMMALERVALMLREMLYHRLEITGHTDSRGSDAYNEKLSEKRALVVKKYLEDKGISPNRLNYEYFGKKKPINDCGEQPCTPNMHKENRRTELSLPKLKKDWTKKEE
ncbi:OmpA family protein [Cyclobacterium sediminis]